MKGRMAETLFEELMKKSGNIVYRFGYEAIVQNLTQLDEKFDRYTEVGEKIRSIPDFIVLDKKGEPILVEVKFRARPTDPTHPDTIKILERLDRFWGAMLVVVNCWEQPYFRFALPPYLGEENKMELIPLVDAKRFSIEGKTYAEYESLVHKYLTPTLVPPQKTKYE